MAPDGCSLEPLYVSESVYQHLQEQQRLQKTVVYKELLPVGSVQLLRSGFRVQLSPSGTRKGSPVQKSITQDPVNEKCQEVHLNQTVSPPECLGTEEVLHQTECKPEIKQQQELAAQVSPSERVDSYPSDDTASSSDISAPRNEVPQSQLCHEPTPPTTELQRPETPCQSQHPSGQHEMSLRKDSVQQELPKVVQELEKKRKSLKPVAGTSSATLAVDDVCQVPTTADAVRIPPDGKHFFTLQQLQGMRAEDGIDIFRKPAYLSNSDFVATFGMDWTTFEALPTWKKIAAKKRVGLF